MPGQPASPDPLILARTASEYDAIPYLSKPFAQSHPGHLAATAQLLGLDPPDVAGARVLELGGASGGNLIPFAASHPGATCKVIDIGPRQVAEGRARADAMGLANFTIDCASLTDLGAGIGHWDYVIAHGVYSWVSAPVREALLRLAGSVLAPGGVMYLSYNVLPGWRMAQPARDAIRALVPEHLDAQTRVRVARDLLALAQRRMVNADLYVEQLKRTAAHLLERSDDFLFHDFMEHENEPFLFFEVMTAADRHGLSFLAEADLCTGFDENFGADFVADVRPRTGGEALPWEALFDVLSGRTFRQSLLVRAADAARIDRAIPPDRLDGLDLLVARGAGIAIEPGTLRASSPHGLHFSIPGDPAANLGRRLLAAAPGSLAVADALRGVAQIERARYLQTIVRLLTAGVLIATASPMRTARAAARPIASRIARADAAAGNPRTTNARHESILLEPEMLLLLPALDGTADHAALAGLLARAMATGLVEPPDGIDPGDQAAVAALVPGWLDGIAGLGLLEG